MADTINLFEYENKVDLPDNFLDLESFLDDIWKNREKSSYYFGNSDAKIESQRFLQFLHKTKKIKSNKYVGVIHFEGAKINLLPKIFFDSSKEDYSTTDTNHIHSHILWWLSYCRKIKFPSYQTSLGGKKSDFFEVLIYLFSKYTRELLSSSIYQQYEEVNSELPFIKGRINTSTYINQNISKGRWHKVNCIYDAFIFDNKFNRIIKYVTTLLFNVTSSSDNKKHLREIFFILDEVSDVKVTAEDCSTIQFNPMFGEFETVRDYCSLFLSNSISFDYNNDLKLFAFLLPMEYVFEDFVFGFLDKEVDEVNAKAQVGSKYLDVSKSFALRPDLFLKTESRSLIADTKYKVIYSDEKDPKKGISQTDLYQMLAYAIRFKINDIVLFYPNTINNLQKSTSEICIEDALAEDEVILIKAYQLPIINKALLVQDYYSTIRLDKLFELTKHSLKIKFQEIFLDN